MRSRALGTTGIQISELGLGTWGLSGDGYGPVSACEQERVIARARALGITLFETSSSYANGEMERRLGHLLEGDGEAVLVTKLGTDLDSVPARKRFDAGYIASAFDASAERLRRDVIDVVLLHNPSEQALANGAATGVLKERVASGRAKAWGVSAGTEAVARMAVGLGAGVISLAHNAFWSGELRGIAGRIQERGTGVLAHSVLAYGMLCGLWSTEKEFGSGDHRAERWTSDDLRRRIRQLDAVRPAVGGPVTSLRAVALRYVLANPLVSSAVLGPRSILQLDQLVRDAGNGPEYLPESRVAALEARLRDVGIDV